MGEGFIINATQMLANSTFSYNNITSRFLSCRWSSFRRRSKISAHVARNQSCFFLQTDNISYTYCLQQISRRNLNRKLITCKHGPSHLFPSVTPFIARQLLRRPSRKEGKQKFTCAANHTLCFFRAHDGAEQPSYFFLAIWKTKVGKWLLYSQPMLFRSTTHLTDKIQDCDCCRSAAEGDEGRTQNQPGPGKTLQDRRCPTDRSADSH